MAVQTQNIDVKFENKQPLEIEIENSERPEIKKYVETICVSVEEFKNATENFEKMKIGLELANNIAAAYSSRLYSDVRFEASELNKVSYKVTSFLLFLKGRIESNEDEDLKTSIIKLNTATIALGILQSYVDKLDLPEQYKNEVIAILNDLQQIVENEA